MKKDIKNQLREYFENCSIVVKSVAENVDVIEKISNGIYECQKAGGKLLIGGNGGSCADAQHFAGELTCTFKSPNRIAFSAISLAKGDWTPKYLYPPTRIFFDNISCSFAECLSSCFI